MFEEYLDKYKQSQSHSEARFKKIADITEEYDKNVPKIKKKDINVFHIPLKFTKTKTQQSFFLLFFL